MRLSRFSLSLCLSLCATVSLFAQKEINPTATVTPTPTPSPTPEVRISPSPTPGSQVIPPRPEPFSSQAFGGLRFRSIGPAAVGGRVNMFAVDPNDRAKYYVAVASGGVWKTVNAGTTWTPVFDGEGSYSIGAIALDPKNPSTVWVGTGEHNSQRSVGYGDGLYRSDDGGRSWRNVGLKTSEHIGRIAIDPRDSNVVFVAAQGPLWSAGGDRGLYKTTDGGKTWKQVIGISENTGVTDVVIDPANPDIVYAASWQRRRHFYTLINGGPESAIYKSTDGGNTFTRLRGGGIPPGDLGRIGLDVSPVDTNVVYATIEASGNLSGIFRSSDRGATWERMSSSIAQGMYYGQIIADPKDVDRVYIPNVVFQVSDDGGRTQRPLGERLKHVDNHAIWVDPKNTDYVLVGCDGGVYESFDRGANWHFKANMPIAQFYDVVADNSFPFYFVYGGTQDNNSLGGPARTRNNAGIMNSDWFVTNGGDGFRSQVDPEDPNTIYSESQNGGLVRFDKRTGERFDIAPFPEKDEEQERTNWDTPFIISPHSHTRLYFAGHRLFRSDNRGDDWKMISSDLTRKLDRNALPVMGKVWGPDAVGKNQSTALYGNGSALAESPLKEGLIYVGTDDGLIQITEDGGKNWRKVEKFPGVPDFSYVSRIFASQHDVNTVYALFNNHQNGDFKPYAMKSTDMGKTWSSINGNLPERGSLYAFAEDPVNSKLLFMGTEFGFFFSIDGGAKWLQLRGGLPTIAVRDIAIHKRENDLILATFGRGIYIMDNYTPLRQVTPEMLNKNSAFFDVKDALMYVRSNAPIATSQGASFFTSPNPTYGATFTYYLKEAPKTLRQKRVEAEREAERRKQPARYPSIAELRAESEEESPALVFVITDSEGKIVRRITAPAAPGIQRVTWDFRTTPPSISAAPPQLQPGIEIPAGFGGFGPQGQLVMPGKYNVSIEMRAGGINTPLEAAKSFEVVVEGKEKMTAEERATLGDFQRKVFLLQRSINSSLQAANQARTQISLLKRSAQEAPAPNQKLVADAKALEEKINDIINDLNGGRENSDIPTPSIKSRADNVADTIRLSLTRPTQTQLSYYNLASSQFAPVYARLKTLVETEIPRLEKALNDAGAPMTPGRLPN